MKHILFIAYNLVGGGAEKALVELLRHFDYSRYEVTLCLLYNEGVYIDEIPAKVKVIVLYDRHDKFHQKSFRKYDKHNNSFWLACRFGKKLHVGVMMPLSRFWKVTHAISLFYNIERKEKYNLGSL